MIFGLPFIDDELQTSSRVLVQAEPGAEMHPMLAHAAARASKQTSVVYIVTQRPPSALRRDLQMFEADMANVVILDGYSGRIGLHDPNAVLLPLHDPSKCIEIIESHQNKQGIVIVDQVLAVVSEFKPIEVPSKLKQGFDGYGHVVAGLIGWQGQPAPALRDAFPDRVRLKCVRDRIITHQYVQVVPEGVDPTIQPRVMVRQRSEVLEAYLPKILIAGAQGSMVSKFMDGACDEVSRAGGDNPAVSLQKGSLQLDGLSAEIFAAPGERRFAALLPKLAAGSLGILIITDPADVDDVERFHELVESLQSQPCPKHVVVTSGSGSEGDAVANLRAKHGDLDASWHAIDIRKPQECRRALAALVRQILHPKAEGRA